MLGSTQVLLGIAVFFSGVS